MITVVPVAIPVTTPVAGFIVATDVLLLLQLPPLTASVNVITEPVHTVAGPAMVPADGAGLIVIACVSIAVPQLFVTV